jgi:uncharacterized membrane protein
MWLRKLAVSVGSSLWFVPVMCVLAGAAISFGTISLDRAYDYQAIPQELVGRPTSANAILTTIAVSMVSLAALVLTITMVVVQLAMGNSRPGSCSGSFATSPASSQSGSSSRPSCTPC